MPFFGSLEYGVWSYKFRKLNLVLTLKAPWNMGGYQIFSERNGYYRYRMPLGLGWRIIVR